MKKLDKVKFLNKSSLIANPPAIIDADKVVALDAIRNSINLIEESYNRLLDNLYKFSFKHRPSIYTLFNDVWNTFGYSTILQNLLITNLECSEDDILLKDIKIHKYLRHTLQHVDERVMEVFTQKKSPIFGTLSWGAQETLTSKKGKVFSINSSIVSNKQILIANNVTPDWNKALIHPIHFFGIIKKDKKFVQAKVDLNKSISDLKNLIDDLEISIQKQLEKFDISSRHKADIVLEINFNWSKKKDK